MPGKGERQKHRGSTRSCLAARSLPAEGFPSPRAGFTGDEGWDSVFSPLRVAGSARRGLPPRCEDHCSACEGSSGNCIKCKEGFSLLGGSCVTNETCTNGKCPWRNPRLRKMRVSGDSLCRVKPKAARLPGARLRWASWQSCWMSACCSNASRRLYFVMF